MQRFLNSVPIAAIGALSLLLLTYVGYGEALRTYSAFQHERLAAEGEILQNAIETFLKAGLPLEQFIGFDTIAEPVMLSDDGLVGITVVDNDSRVRFSKQRTGFTFPPAGVPSAGDGGPSMRFGVVRDDLYDHVTLPLASRFERLGQLVLTVRSDSLVAAVDARFRDLVRIVGLLTLAIAVIALAIEVAARRRPIFWHRIVYGAVFLVMASLVTWSIASLYSEAVQGKAAALGNSLGQRLGQVFALDLDLSDIDGLDTTFADYRRLNPEIGEIALIRDGRIAIGTDPQRLGAAWLSNPDNFEYLAAVGDGNAIRLAVAVPYDVILGKVARSVKNFAVLFVACAFLALLLMQGAAVTRQLRVATRPGEQAPGLTEPEIGDLKLALVTPIFFLAVFVEALNAAFLPGLMAEIAEGAGMPGQVKDLLFMTYFLGFAAILVPAGRLAELRGPRPLMLGGLALAACGLLIMAFAHELPLVAAARAFSGIGQGALFIGVQSYILRMAQESKRTQGAAIIVFAFNGAIISGSAIGGLLVAYMGPEGVFLVAAAITGLTFLNCFLQIADLGPSSPDAAAAGGIGRTLARMGGDLKALIADRDFLRTMLLIGIPTKAVLTGVAIFALPLVLSGAGFAKEDIGQLIMLYGAGVLIASRQVSRLVDRVGQTTPVLFWGALLSALALVAIGASGSPRLAALVPLPHVELATLAIGVLTLGLAHGFINAPVVTHVSRLPVSIGIGSGSATATYRFLERLGHVAGPLLLGQFLLWTDHDPLTIAYVGAAIAAMALLFVIPLGGSRPRSLSSASGGV
ncbi:MFS transporter [Oceanibacterium hippocampi]|uniref:Multidrug efflux system protein MdtL n=1 Tax=Oceanibacterium hippocampi TaxID=745714 RepID=A0A1Y5R7U4_9PROT|nr:MFS transporter [Oceanibacterium hippocampi]SLN10816.1 multidrug efflux system protein MdtL [Oceanibacterium hippocampi]